MRNLNTPNFNLGARQMDLALKNALSERGLSYQTKASYHSHFKDFVNHIKNEGVRNLREIDKSNIESWAQTLVERYENGEKAASSINTMLSAVNTAMEIARQDKNVWVDPKKDAGLPSKTGIAKNDKSISADTHEHIKSQINERLAIQLELQRELGLRFKESCLMNANSTFNQATATGSIKISLGTKGGKTRTIENINLKQLQTLKLAAEIQKHERSMIPSGQSWSNYQNQCYRDISKTQLNGFHCERHTYANNRYESIIGVKSPVRAGIKHGKSHFNYIAQQKNISIQDAKKLDWNTRITISEELGHCRVSITSSYLG